MMPPYCDISDLPNQAQMFARNCNNEKLAMTMQYVALGSMVCIAGVGVAHMIQDLFREHYHEPTRGMGRGR